MTRTRSAARRRVRRVALWGAAGLLFCGALGYGLLQLSRSRSFQFFGGIINHVDTREKRVALTFDDGPEPGRTEELLSVLRRHDARATFFLIGADIERRPELARSIVAAGHQIGNHSFSHQRMIGKSAEFIRTEVERTSRAIRAIGYDGPMTFRPPYGKKLVGLPYYLRSQGIPTILWDIEPDSYSDVAASPERIVAHVIDRVQPGSIILLHANNRRPSLDAVEPLLRWLGQQGFRSVTLAELLRSGHP